MAAEDLEALIDDADFQLKRIDGGEVDSDLLRGRAVATLFFEPSTRTRISFERAATLLGAHVMTFDPGNSSMSKGESTRDTVLTLAAMGPDVLVVRHRSVGLPAFAARWSSLPVVNAGDGRGEHPTQALADALTLRRHFGGLSGLRMGIVGDVANSRVARSLLWALPTLGVEVTLIGPSGLLPDRGPWGAQATSDFDSALPELDAVYMLRMQAERGSGSAVPPGSGYAKRFSMDERRMGILGPDAVIMHPGPINRGVEISSVVADSPRSLILRQVGNGVAVRMAVLARAAGAP